MTVSHHQPVPVLINRLNQGIDVGVSLRPQRSGQHLNSWPTSNCQVPESSQPCETKGSRNAEVGQFASAISARPQLSASPSHRTAEPKRLRLRIFAVAAGIIRTGRRTLLRLPADWTWASEVAAARARLRALPAPH